MAKILLSANTDWYLYNYRMALARTLRDKGYDVVLVSPQGDYTSDLQDEGFRWIRWEVSRKGTVPLDELRSLTSLARIYRAEMPDLVHHHTIKPVLYGSMAARLAKVPCIINSITGRGHVFSSGGNRASFIRNIVSWFY